MKTQRQLDAEAKLREAIYEHAQAFELTSAVDGEAGEHLLSTFAIVSHWVPMNPEHSPQLGREIGTYHLQTATGEEPSHVLIGLMTIATDMAGDRWIEEED